MNEFIMKEFADLFAIVFSVTVAIIWFVGFFTILSKFFSSSFESIKLIYLLITKKHLYDRFIAEYENGDKFGKAVAVYDLTGKIPTKDELK